MHKNLLAFTVATIIDAQAVQATDYTITTIDFPGAAGTIVTGINPAGRVIGNYVPAGSNSSFGFTARGGTFISVGDSLPCRPNGRCLTGAVAVNALGQIAGTFSADVDFPGAFIQTANSAPVVVEPPGYPNTAIVLAGLNNFGLLAGCYSNEALPNQIFEQIGGYFKTISLPVAGVLDACARGLNNLGQLAGSYETSGGIHGFVLSGAHLRTIDLPAEWGGVDIQPMGINDRGLVIGTYEIAANVSGITTHGFVVSGDDIEKIDFPGATDTAPSAVNDRGEILGTYDIAATGTAVRYTFILRGRVYSTVALPLPGPATILGLDGLGRLYGYYFDTNCAPTCPSHGFIATPKAE